MSKTILACYYGELGWELFGFQGYMRALSKNNDIKIITRPGHDVLYEDFAKEIHHYKPSSRRTRYAKCEGEILPDKYYDQFEFDELIPFGVQLVHWSTSKGNYGLNKNFLPKNFKPEYIKFGGESDDAYDILIHARDTHKLGSGSRNWGRDKWDILTWILAKNDYRVACIGSEDGSYCPRDVVDKRDIPLDKLCDLMACSRLVVGSSSGPMHLASLCGTPHLVWSAPINKNRYMNDWNPFSTECLFYAAEGWNPMVDSVEMLINKFFLSLR